MANPWVAMLLVLLSFGALVAGLRMVRRRWAPDPELVRKLLHLGMGTVSLTFPWAFSSPWPVLLLAAVFVLGLSLLRRRRSRQDLLGAVIDGVGRRSLGEVYFPGAVGLLFLVSAGDPLTFGIPLLILTLADSAGALIGVRYGTARYDIGGGAKTLEGSAAFFLTTCLCTSIPLLVVTGRGPGQSLLMGLLLGLLLTFLEAAAGHGLDNLTVPLGAYAGLQVCLEWPGPPAATWLSIVALLTLLLGLRPIAEALRHNI